MKRSLKWGSWILLIIFINMGMVWYFIFKNEVKITEYFETPTLAEDDVERITNILLYEQTCYFEEISSQMQSKIREIDQTHCEYETSLTQLELNHKKLLSDRNETLGVQAKLDESTSTNKKLVELLTAKNQNKLTFRDSLQLLKIKFKKDELSK